MRIGTKVFMLAAMAVMAVADATQPPFPYFPVPGIQYDSGLGMALDPATGGLQGIKGSLNATALYINGAAVAAGGTPGAPNGSVQFNSGGVFTGNANFTYNAGTDVLQLSSGLATGTFAVGQCASMIISGAALAIPSFCSNSNFQGNVEMHSTSAIAAGGSFLYGVRARGTLLAPATVQNGDNLLTIGGAGFDGTNYTWGAHIHFLADGTPSAGVLPGAIDIQTTPDGSATPLSRLLIDHFGAFIVNGSAGTAGQVLLSGGAGVAASWGALNLAGPGVTGILPQTNILTCAANQIVYDNVSAVLTCSAAFTFDGSNTVTLGTGTGVYKSADASTSTGNGQQVMVKGGAGGVTSGNGQAATLIGGTAADGNTGGFQAASPNAASTTAANRSSGIGLIQTGNGLNGGSSGTITMKTGAGGATGNSGTVTVSTGPGGATSGSSGVLSVSTGPTSGAANRSGNMTFNTGNATLASAGNIVFNAGTSGSPASCSGGVGLCTSILFSYGTQDYLISDYLANLVQDPQTAFTSASNDGFFWLGGATGVPTGTPTQYNSDYIHSSPLYVDRNTMDVWAYDFGNARWADIATPIFSGTTGSIGGGALAAGACASGTVAIANTTTAMAVIATPVTYPGDGTDWKGYVSAAGTVTVKVCALVAVTPAASTYNVRVLQ